jgi:hypothetical protein
LKKVSGGGASPSLVSRQSISSKTLNADKMLCCAVRFCLLLHLLQDSPLKGVLKFVIGNIIGVICSIGMVNTMAGAGMVMSFGEFFSETGRFEGPCPGPREPNGECCTVSSTCPP